MYKELVLCFSFLSISGLTAMKSGETVVSDPYVQAHIVREAGLADHQAKTYLLERAIESLSPKRVTRHQLAQPTPGIRVSRGKVTIAAPTQPQDSVLKFYIAPNNNDLVYEFDTGLNNMAINLQNDTLQVEGIGAVSNNMGLLLKKRYHLNFPLFEEIFRFFNTNHKITAQQYGILNKLIVRAQRRETSASRIPMTDDNRRAFNAMIAGYPAIKAALEYDPEYIVSPESAPDQVRPPYQVPNTPVKRRLEF